MENKMIEKLNKIGQLHIAKRLKDNNQLEEQVKRIDFEQIMKLYEGTKKSNDIEQKKFEGIGYVEKDKLSRKEYEELSDIGEEVIKNGRYAVVTMAGGQGTRLGHTGPKGTYKIDLVTGEKFLFEILVDSLKQISKKYDVDVPCYIMKSRENNNQTQKFLEEHSYFGYPSKKVKLFMQGELPLIDTNGKILLDKNGCIKEASDGNGGIYEAINKSGVLQDMKQKCIEWIFIGGIDNILLNISDPILIGLTVKQRNLIASKSVVKSNPKERVGVFGRVNGKPKVIEYTELPEKMAEETDANGNLIFGDANILNHLLNIKVLEDLANVKLPYHIALKKAGYLDEHNNYIEPTEPNAYKFEAFIFDAFERYEDMSVLRVKREDEFAPIKNAEGADSPETAKKLYNNKMKEN